MSDPTIPTEPDEQLADVYGDGQTWRKRWLPTPKWAVALIVGLHGLAAAYIQAGEWNDTLSIVAITLASARLVAYIAPNGTRVR